MFVFQKQKETFHQDEIPITSPSSNVTTKPSELLYKPNASNKTLTTPLTSGTQNETPTNMTSNTRKRRSRFSTQLTSYIQKMNINHEDQLDVVMLWLKQLNLLDTLSLFRKPTKAGRKFTSLATRRGTGILLFKLHIFNNNIIAS